MGETTKCDVLVNGCERHGYVGCTECTADELRALRARLSAAERERDEAVAEKDVYYRDLIAAGELRVSEQEDAFARGVEAAAALVKPCEIQARDHDEALEDSVRRDLYERIRALAPATDAKKETT